MEIVVFWPPRMVIVCKLDWRTRVMKIKRFNYIWVILLIGLCGQFPSVALAETLSDVKAYMSAYKQYVIKSGEATGEAARAGSARSKAKLAEEMARKYARRPGSSAKLIKKYSDAAAKARQVAETASRNSTRLSGEAAKFALEANKRAKVLPNTLVQQIQTWTRIRNFGPRAACKRLFYGAGGVLIKSFRAIKCAPIIYLPRPGEIEQMHRDAFGLPPVASYENTYPGDGFYVMEYGAVYESEYINTPDEEIPVNALANIGLALGYPNKYGDVAWSANGIPDSGFEISDFELFLFLRSDFPELWE